MRYPNKVEMREGHIDWMYPEIYGDDEARSVLSIGLNHVRSANNIEIEYDSNRDGWVIYMTTTVDYRSQSDGHEEPEPVTERREKAFIPAWDKDDVVWNE